MATSNLDRRLTALEKKASIEHKDWCDAIPDPENPEAATLLRGWRNGKLVYLQRVWVCYDNI